MLARIYLYEEITMFKMKYIIVILLTLLMAAGCGSKQVKPQTDNTTSSSDNTTGTSVSIEEGEGVSSSGLNDNDDIVLDELDDPASDLFIRTIYFDYDSSNIRDDSIIIVRGHGKYLSENSQRVLRLEGHADERGTREYNLALGEERAKSVREIMIIEGALPEQIEVVSFGEERPAVDGEDDESLRLNRRVEIVY